MLVWQVWCTTVNKKGIYRVLGVYCRFWSLGRIFWRFWLTIQENGLCKSHLDHWDDFDKPWTSPMALTRPKLWPHSEIALLTWPSKVGRYFSCSRVITRPNDDGFYPKIAHQNAHSKWLEEKWPWIWASLSENAVKRINVTAWKPPKSVCQLMLECLNAWIRWLLYTAAALSPEHAFGGGASPEWGQVARGVRFDIMSLNAISFHILNQIWIGKHH